MSENSFDKLVEILNREYDNYQELKQLACSKKEIIIENDIEQLSKIIEEDEKIVNQLHGLEQKRDRLLSQLEVEYELQGESINFQSLQDNLSADKQQELQEIRDRLLVVIEQLDRKNEENRKLLEEAIKLNDFSFEMMTRILEPGNQTYGNNKADNPDRTNHIMNRQA